MAERTIKWGIMGPGGISRAFAEDLAHAPGAELLAVAGRSLEKAEAFAETFQIPRAYGSCEELAEDPHIDIVYIGTLHPAHKENVLTCLEGGKAVLCEKPFTMNADEAEEIIEYAREHKLLLMEAMWTRYLPAIVKVREWLAEKAIGDIQLISGEFGFDVGWSPDGRLLNREKGGGALLDAGIYPVSFASMVMGGAQPKRILSSSKMGKTGVDEQFSLLFEYESGARASLQGAVRLKLNNNMTLYGTRGKIEIPHFLAARSAVLEVDGEEAVVFEDQRASKGYNFEAIEAMHALREGRTESAVHPIEETLNIMRTLDAIREQWELKYPGEE